MGIEILRPQCNLLTVKDGRGGIFTWVPDQPIREFNLLYFKPGATRGNHLHPEFTEFFLVVDGEGVMVTCNPENENEEVILHMAKGSCTRCPSGVPHAFYAITAVTAVAMLTKPWDDCDPPIIHEEIMNRVKDLPAPR